MFCKYLEKRLGERGKVHTKLLTLAMEKGRAFWGMFEFSITDQVFLVELV